MDDGPRVLVVDDDGGTREAVKTLLEEEGYVVELADSGAAALARLGAPGPAPSLVLLDLRMPGMDGETLLDHLERTQESVPPVVLMTATGPGPSTSALRYPLLRKPFGLDALMEVVTAYCPRLWDDEEEPTDRIAIERPR